MSSRRVHPNIAWEAVEASVAKNKQRDREATAAIVEALGARSQRRENLDKRAAPIRRATDRYAHLDRGEQPEIRIRRPFVRLDTARPRQEDDSWPKTVQEALKADVDS